MSTKTLFVTASIKEMENKKIIIKVEDIRKALEVERSLFNQKTLEIYNIRLSRSRPKSFNSNKEIIKSLDEIQAPNVTNSNVENRRELHIY